MKKILLAFLIMLAGCINNPTADIGNNNITNNKDPNLPLVGIGTVANDGTGDPLRTAFGKVNQAITQINTNTADILLRLKISDTAAMLAHYAKITAVGLKLNISDTAAMLTHYAKKTDLGETTGISAADTALMLTPYINHNDTASMLEHYAKITAVGLRLLKSDTASMLTNYARFPEVRTIVHDSISSYLSEAEVGIALADSGKTSEGNYVTYKQLHEYASTYDTTYLYYKIDSLIDVVDQIQTDLDGFIDALNNLGVDLVAPRFLSAELGGFADDTLIMIMDTTDIHQDSIPPLSAFNLTESGDAFGLDEILIGHDTVYIVLDSVGAIGKTYLLDYTKPTAINTKALQDSTGNKTASWTDKAVTNGFPALVSSIDVWGTGAATTIATEDGTLQMLKKTLPTNAADTTATWSVDDEDIGTISAGGLLTAVGNGTVEVTATANDGSAVHGHESITVSNQPIPARTLIATDGHTWGWYIYTDEASITKDGSDRVSEWADTLDSGHDLLQATEADMPVVNANGVLFDGANDRIYTANATLEQPMFVYMVVKQVTWTEYDFILQGLNVTTPYIQQFGTTPNIVAGAGTDSSPSTDMTLNTYVIIRALYNGANSKFIVDAHDPITGNFGTGHSDGICIANITTGGYGANIEVKELIIRTEADTSGDEATIYNYLKAKYGL